MGEIEGRDRGKLVGLLVSCKYVANQTGIYFKFFFCLFLQFYHSFTKCTQSQTPLMSDSFDLLLKKLTEIQWDTLTSMNNLPGGCLQSFVCNFSLFTIVNLENIVFSERPKSIFWPIPKPIIVVL